MDQCGEVRERDRDDTAFGELTIRAGAHSSRLLCATCDVRNFPLRQFSRSISVRIRTRAPAPSKWKHLLRKGFPPHAIFCAEIETRGGSRGLQGPVATPLV